MQIVPKTRLQPDTRHFFGAASKLPLTHVRLDVFPDGGLARLRINGEIDDATLGELTAVWQDSLPDVHFRAASAADL